MSSSTTTEDGAMPALSVRDLTKTFAGTLALDRVSLGVLEGEVHALLGENGSGKSTLIKILSGYHRPDHGYVEVGGNELPFGDASASHSLGARFVHQDLGLIDSISVLDNLILASDGYPTRVGTIRGRRARELAEQTLQAVGLDLDVRQPVGKLSLAERTGVAIARALRVEESPVRLLVLDEPTATLPDAEVSRLMGIIRAVQEQRVGVMYVTHRLDEVHEIADVATILRDGRLVATTAVADLSREDLLRHLLGAEFKELESEEPPKLDPGRAPILSVDGLRVGSIKELSFDAAPGEIVGIAGITGSGRELVCAALFGSTPRVSGGIAIDGRSIPQSRPEAALEAGGAFLPADRKRHGGFPELTARENLTIASLKAFWKRGFLRRGPEREEARTWSERLDVRPRDHEDSKLATFSGGNQQKILLAKWLRLGPKVLLVDEPTQGVDVGARAALHRELIKAAAAGAVVVVSSTDTDELVGICHRILILRRGRIAAQLRGSDISVGRVARECADEGEMAA